MFERLRDIFRPEQKAIDDPWLILAGGVDTFAGRNVSVDTAMKCPTVFACTRVISEAVAQIPLILYQRDANGDREKATDHPLFTILRHQPNDWTSAYEFRLDMQLDVLKHGSAFAFINRDRDGMIRELIQIPFTAIKCEINSRTMEPEYELTEADGSQRKLDRREVFHLRAMGGMSPIKQAREAIGLSMVLEEHAARLFGQGAKPSGILETDGMLNVETIKRLKASFQSAMGGAINSGKVLIAEQGMKWKSVTMTSVDSQFQEMRRYQTAEISRTFRVPLSLINDLERVTHSNAEALGQQFLTFTILPPLKMWEGAIRRSLLLPDERETHFAEFMVDDLARAELAKRFEAYAKAVTNGILNPNEVRAMENRPPYEEGDVFMRQLNTGTAQEGPTDGT